MIAKGTQNRIKSWDAGEEMHHNSQTKKYEYFVFYYASHVVVYVL